MARAAGLPQKVIDFIPTHHGTALIEYFYQRARERQTGSDSDVQESEFRYPGPKPTSRETAILMLADSVEAASRSLSNPTHKRLEAIIDSIFKSRVEDRQLENTDLTFRELDEIKDTFLSLLLGMYHVRVKYPGQDRIEEEAEPREDVVDEETPDRRQLTEKEESDSGDLPDGESDLFAQDSRSKTASPKSSISEGAPQRGNGSPNG